MTLFDGISRTGDGLPIDPRRVEQTSQERPERQEKPEKVSPHRKDSANISADAAEVSRYQEMARLHREAYGPADRSDKLAQVKERIASGHYDDPEVMNAIADKMIDAGASASVKAEDTEMIRQRAANGYYDRPEVVDKTAENMLKSVMPRNRGK